MKVIYRDIVNEITNALEVAAKMDRVVEAIELDSGEMGELRAYMYRIGCHPYPGPQDTFEFCGVTIRPKPRPHT